jgi:hypothetical protein
MDSIADVQLLDHRRQIVGVSVHLVPVPWLAGPAMASAVVRDAAITAVRKKQHLILKRV